MAAVLHETEAIVLDSLEHGESDLILTLFCRDMGRTSVIAKGARKSLKRFVNKLEIFSALQATLRQSGNRSLLHLEEAELSAGFIRIRQEITGYSAASVAREMLLAGTREGEPDERLYLLALKTLDSFDRHDRHLQTLLSFLLLYLEYIGYRPELDCCTECGLPWQQARQPAFQVSSGGLVCGCSAGVTGQLIALSPETLRLLQAVRTSPIEQLHLLTPHQHAVHEGLNILHRFGRHVLQREIVSWRMLRQIFVAGKSGG